MTMDIVVVLNLIAFILNVECHLYDYHSDDAYDDYPIDDYYSGDYGVHGRPQMSRRLGQRHTLDQHKVSAVDRYENGLPRSDYERYRRMHQRQMEGDGNGMSDVERREMNYAMKNPFTEEPSLFEKLKTIIWEWGEWLGIPGFTKIRETRDATYWSDGKVIYRVPKKRKKNSKKTKGPAKKKKPLKAYTV